MDAAAIPILIVDDDPTTAAMLRGLVRNLGDGLSCASTCVTTGAAARREFGRGGYDLVLLDYQLPDEDGLTLLAALNAQPARRRPPVIMLTGAGSETVAVEAMKLGASDYLIKTALNHATLRRAISAALDRRRLEERLAESTDLLRRQHAQLETDLAMARVVQQALLPQDYPVFPPGVAADQSRLRFAHRWIPTHQVAGDFFAVLPVSATAAGVFLCDVMGHGVRAALITTHLRGLLHEHEAQAGDPGAFLTALNRHLQALLERVGETVFVTAAYAVVDAASGELLFANAGHPAPLHLERGASRVSPCLQPDGPGPALGLIPDFTYDTARRSFAAGDAVLLYTDGLYEAEDATGEQFGQKRLAAAVTARLGQQMAWLLDGLLADVQATRPPGAGPLPDDVCLVAAERVG
ncbi:fused response regulator/phosphatase [Oleiharenicola lentus]|uniref:Fused response regulator/phosphatase n=1 Tax=Oleiharenicola lentus TaxID=2508720 RepID=A0A4Q1C6J6_9BACT|nr:SpoIIE family protein phosphatase [Oleiharenicola lentus]RXK54507.1 fused response regulator/phosphatase [Oleiharenicola lentus]